MLTDPEQNQAHWLTKSESILRKGSISNISYSLNITLTPSSFSGICTISFTSTLPTTWLDLNGATIDSTILNSLEYLPSYHKSRLTLEPLIQGENLITISYSRDYSKDGYGLHCYHESTGETYIFSHFEPFHAHKMFPCFDQPDLKATYKLQVKCPKHWKVLSNDLAEHIIEESEHKVHFFPLSLKFSTYLVALIAGDYAEWKFNGGKFPMAIYCRKSLAQEMDEEKYFKWTVRGFEFYQNLFDFLYPFRKYDQVFVPEFNSGAMENVGCVTIKEDLLKRSQSKTQMNLAAFTFLHEMSHMWFGNLVTMKWWDDIWLNESFATYLSYLAVDSCLNDDFQQSWLLFLRRKTFAYMADQKKTTHPISSHVENTSQTRNVFDSISYSKGASVIKQIVFIMGLNDFSESIQQYLKLFQFSNTEFSDFISTLSQKKPELTLWADDWLKTSGVNFIYTEITENSVNLTQKAEGTCEKIKTHEFFCELYDENCTLIDKKRVKMHSETLSIPTESQISCILMNIEDQDYVKVIIDDQSISFIQKNYHLFASPLTRMLIITQLLEMVNSLLLPTTVFLNMLYFQFCGESEEIIANYILTTASSTLISKVSEESIKNEFYTMFYNKILEKIQLSADFEDTILSFIYTDQQIAEAIKWLEGNSPINLTQQRRWRLLKQYSRLCVEAKELVDRENDSSYEAKLARLYCDAVYPDPETKAKAWQMFISGCPGLSRFERKSAMSGFLKKSQRSIIKQYSSEFFKSVPIIKKNFNSEYLVDFCTLLFPEYKKIVYLKNKVEKLLRKIGEDNKQIVKIFMDKIEVIERNRRIKGSIN